MYATSQANGKGNWEDRENIVLPTLMIFDGYKLIGLLP
mgnify:CR=1 FL=1